MKNVNWLWRFDICYWDSDKLDKGNDNQLWEDDNSIQADEEWLFGEECIKFDLLLDIQIIVF